MSNSRSKFSFGLTVGLLAIVVVAAILTAAFLPVADCPYCGGDSQIISFLSGTREVTQCRECRGCGKISLLAKWNRDRKIVTAPPPR